VWCPTTGSNGAPATQEYPLLVMVPLAGIAIESPTAGAAASANPQRATRPDSAEVSWLLMAARISAWLRA